MIIQIKDSMKNGVLYEGATPKFGATINGVDCIVKFPKRNDLSVFTEYMASNFIRTLNVPCQEVQLGEYKGIYVAVIKDFAISTGCELHSYRSTGQSSVDTSLDAKSYTYKDAVHLIETHTKMSEQQKEVALEMFWKMYILDAILGNRDRHSGNWGYLIYSGKDYRFAPIYDNGGCLFPGVNKVINEYIDPSTRNKMIHDRVYMFPASLLKRKGRDRDYKTNYYEVLSDLRINKTLAHNVQAIRKTLSWKHVYKIMYNICVNIPLDDNYKRFFIEIATVRFRCIIMREDFDTAFKEVDGKLWQRRNS